MVRDTKPRGIKLREVWGTEFLFLDMLIAHRGFIFGGLTFDYRVRGGAVGSGIALYAGRSRVRFLMGSLT
jgi:hypothetical protein